MKDSIEQALACISYYIRLLITFWFPKLKSHIFTVLIVSTLFHLSISTFFWLSVESTMQIHISCRIPNRIYFLRLLHFFFRTVKLFALIISNLLMGSFRIRIFIVHSSWMRLLFSVSFVQKDMEKGLKFMCPQ